MPLPTSDYDKDFATSIRELIDIAPEDVATRLEMLDSDEILALMDAVTKKDRGRTGAIINKAKGAADKRLASVLGGDTETPADKPTTKQESDTGVTYSIGDKVTVGDKEGTIRIPTGPHDTIGVVIDGKVKMVDRQKVRRMDECEDVTGTGGFRLDDLLAAAGLKPYPLTHEVVDEPTYATADRLRSLAGLPATPQAAAETGMTNTVYLEVKPTIDPEEAAQAALSAIQTLAEVLPHIRLADLKVIRANIVATLNAMNENATNGRDRI